MNFIQTGGKLVCLIGQWGSGKTSTAKQVYVSVTHTSPLLIQNYLTFDGGDQPVIFDNAISKEITDVEKYQLRDKIRKLYENMSRSGIRSFIIITVDEDMEHLYGFVRSLIHCQEDVKFIDLSKSLAKEDRIQILHTQFSNFSPNQDFSRVECLALKGQDHSLGYPEICALFSRCSVFQNVGPLVFCNRPLQHIRWYLEKMHKSEDNKQFLMLVFMSLNQMVINVNASNDMLFEILRSCSCSTSLIDKNRQEESKAEEDSFSKSNPKTNNRKRDYIKSLLSNEFAIKDADSSIYKLQHEVLKRMTLIVFGTHHFDKLLELSQPEDLEGWIKEKKNKCYPCKRLGDMRPVLKIKRELWRQY